MRYTFTNKLTPLEAQKFMHTDHALQKLFDALNFYNLVSRKAIMKTTP